MSKLSTKPIRVILIEDNRYIRSGWEMILKNEKDFEIVGSFATCEEAFDSNRIGEADVVVMDIKLPGMSGIKGTACLKKHYPNLSVVICTAYEDDENTFKALCAGAVGFLAKNTSPSDFLYELHEAAAGRSPMTPKVARLIVALVESRKIRVGKTVPSFLPEEREILSGIAAGNSYNAIAARLSVQVTDITLRIRQIYQKLHQYLNSSTEEELS